jgi:hypothetical protein
MCTDSKANTSSTRDVSRSCAVDCHGSSAQVKKMGWYVYRSKSEYFIKLAAYQDHVLDWLAQVEIMGWYVYQSKNE